MSEMEANLELRSLLRVCTIYSYKDWGDMDKILWKGIPINDIDKFCKDHNTTMINYIAKRRIHNPYFNKIKTEIIRGRMPEIFFDNLRHSDGFIYTKVK